MEIDNAQALIVDDDPDVRALVRRVLTGAGMRVEEARDVEMAFEVAAKQPPHVIVSDLNMPGKSGFDLIERCRRTSALRDTPILVLSAASDKASVFRAISLGANDYILKPFQPAALTQKLRKVLKNRDIHRHEFVPGSFPAVSVVLPCTIEEAGEAGLRVEAPVRIGRDVVVKLSSPLIQGMGLDGHLIRTSPRTPVLRREGLYLNEALPVGLSEAAAQKIRRFLKDLP
jgi:CheY-like chemotaxis protein